MLVEGVAEWGAPMGGESPGFASPASPPTLFFSLCIPWLPECPSCDLS